MKEGKESGTSETRESDVDREIANVIGRLHWKELSEWMNRRNSNMGAFVVGNSGFWILQNALLRHHTQHRLAAASTGLVINFSFFILSCTAMVLLSF